MVNVTKITIIFHVDYIFLLFQPKSDNTSMHIKLSSSENSPAGVEHMIEVHENYE